MLASSYAFYFAADYLVKRYAEMKMTHDEAIVADVHALSAGLKAHITAFTAKVGEITKAQTTAENFKHPRPEAVSFYTSLYSGSSPNFSRRLWGSKLAYLM